MLPSFVTLSKETCKSLSELPHRFPFAAEMARPTFLKTRRKFEAEMGPTQRLTLMGLHEKKNKKPVLTFYQTTTTTMKQTTEGMNATVGRTIRSLPSSLVLNWA